jgi:hypothetical protein
MDYRAMYFKAMGRIKLANALFESFKTIVAPGGWFKISVGVPVCNTLWLW